MVVEHPSGALFVSGHPRQDPRPSVPRMSPNLLRSDDGGAMWTRVDVGTPAASTCR